MTRRDKKSKVRSNLNPECRRHRRRRRRRRAALRGVRSVYFPHRSYCVVEYRSVAINTRGGVKVDVAHRTLCCVILCYYFNAGGALLHESRARFGPGRTGTGQRRRFESEYFTRKTRADLWKRPPRRYGARLSPG